MRVGENSTLNTVRDSLNRSRLRMNELQKQNSTMKRVNKIGRASCRERV